MPIKQLKSKLIEILQSYSPTPYLDADYILSKVFAINKSQLYSETTIDTTRKQLSHFDQIIHQIKQQKPLAYIFEEKEFYNLTYKVTPAVLIPRPETELIVDIALTFIKDSKNRNLTMLDIGTGTGCIPISILANTTQQITSNGVDISTLALLIANTNKTNLLDKKVASHLTFLNSDLFNLMLPDTFDIITSNPPYIPTKEITTLHSNVKDFEPLIALDGGDDGLNYYRKLTEIIDKYLKPEGIAILELHSTLAEKIKSLFGHFNTKLHYDLAELPRVLVISKK